MYTVQYTVQYTDLIQPVLHLHFMGRTMFVEAGGFMVAPNMQRVAGTTVFVSENVGVLFQKEDEVVAAVTVWDPALVSELASVSPLEASAFQERLENLRRNGGIVAKGEYSFFMEDLHDAQKPYESD